MTQAENVFQLTGPINQETLCLTYTFNGIIDRNVLHFTKYYQIPLSPYNNPEIITVHFIITFCR